MGGDPILAFHELRVSGFSDFAGIHLPKKVECVKFVSKPCRKIQSSQTCLECRGPAAARARQSPTQARFDKQTNTPAGRIEASGATGVLVS